jgi:hypothetical protein
VGQDWGVGWGDCGVHWLFRKKIARERLRRQPALRKLEKPRQAGRPSAPPFYMKWIFASSVMTPCSGGGCAALHPQPRSTMHQPTSVPRGPPGCRPVRSARKSRALPTGYCHAWPYLRCERRPHASVEGVGARALPKMLAGVSHRLKARQPSRSHLSDPAVEVASDPLAGRRTRVPALEAARGILQTSATIRALAGDFGSLF